MAVFQKVPKHLQRKLAMHSCLQQCRPYISSAGQSMPIFADENMDTLPMNADEVAKAAASIHSPVPVSGPTGREPLPSDSPATKRAKYQHTIPISDDSMVLSTEIDKTPGEIPAGADDTQHYETEFDGNKSPEQSLPPNAKEAPSKVLGLRMSSTNLLNSLGYSIAPCVK